MMGAVRRWYDTVTAQLATYLPLTGGTMTGPLTVPSLTATGNVNALDVGCRDIVASRNIHAAGDTFATGTSTAAQLTSTGNANVAGTVQAAQLTSTGSVNAAGNIVATLDIGCRSLNAGNTVQAAQLTSSGNINAAGTVTGTSFIGNVSVPASGPVTTGGTVTGGQLTSTGNINASGNITGANLLAGSSVYVAGNPALSVTTAGRLDILTPSGDLALVLYGSPTWQNSYFNNTHQFGNSGRDFTYATFGVAGCFNVSGTWGTFSDASLKDDVAPYERGLDAILGLSPISFRYQAHTPFADPERTLRYGLMAQDVAGIIPEMVGETSLETGGTVGTVFPGHLVFVLVNAAKELAAQNAALAARIEALEGNHV